MGTEVVACCCKVACNTRYLPSSCNQVRKLREISVVSCCRCLNADAATRFTRSRGTVRRVGTGLCWDDEKTGVLRRPEPAQKEDERTHVQQVNKSGSSYDPVHAKQTLLKASAKRLSSDGAATEEVRRCALGSRRRTQCAPTLQNTSPGCSRCCRRRPTSGNRQTERMVNVRGDVTVSWFER